PRRRRGSSGRDRASWSRAAERRPSPDWRWPPRAPRSGAALSAPARGQDNAAMKFSKSPAWLVQLFQALQPEVGGTPRQMFGYPCAFENGQLFTGLFADGLFV